MFTLTITFLFTLLLSLHTHQYILCNATQHIQQHVVHISHQVKGDGFHQTYQTQFLLDQSINQTIEAIKFIWLIPSGIYLDVDELNAYSKYQLNHAQPSDLICHHMSNDFIDIEQPESKSDSHQIEVICKHHNESINLNISNEFDTLFHLRYHAPSNHTRYHAIQLKPNMVQKCYLGYPDYNLNASHDNQLKWMKATLHWLPGNDLTLFMPVAALNHQYLVGLSTLITIACGLFVVCYLTCQSQQCQTSLMKQE